VGKSQLGNPEIEATRIARPAFYVNALDVRFLDSTIELSHIGTRATVLAENIRMPVCYELSLVPINNL